jgi:Fe2+ transport system protein FeoA
MLPRRGDQSLAVKDRLTLDDADRDAIVRVVRVAGRPRLIQRLAALGLVPGASLTVLKPHGPAIVSLGGARIAIGRAAAQSVEIEITG